MRPIMKTTLCALVAAALAASPRPARSPLRRTIISSSATSKPEQSEGRVGREGGPGKQIEILSWSWGATSARRSTAPWPARIATTGLGARRKAPARLGDRRRKPLDRGAVRVKVKFPWLECKVGAAFPDAVLQNDAGRYEFKDAIITGCAPDGVSLNYAKVRVRGWDPEKKE